MNKRRPRPGRRRRTNGPDRRRRTVPPRRRRPDRRQGPERPRRRRGHSASRPAPSSSCGPAASATTAAAGQPGARHRLHAGGDRLAGIEFAPMASEFNYILMLAQSETERLAHRTARRQGVKVERGVEFVSSPNMPTPSVHMRTRRHSRRGRVLRHRRRRIAQPGPQGARTALRGHVAPPELRPRRRHLTGDVPEDQLSIFLAPNGFLAVFPMGGGRFRFMATDPDGSPATPTSRRWQTFRRSTTAPSEFPPSSTT